MFTYRLTVVITRPSTVAELWFFSGNPTQAFWQFSDALIAEGKMSNSTWTYSPDLLTATKITDFTDEATFNTVTSNYETTFLTLFAARDAYETANGQVRTHTSAPI